MHFDREFHIVLRRFPVVFGKLWHLSPQSPVQHPKKVEQRRAAANTAYIMRAVADGFTTRTEHGVEQRNCAQGLRWYGLLRSYPNLLIKDAHSPRSVSAILQDRPRQPDQLTTFPPVLESDRKCGRVRTHGNVSRQLAVFASGHELAIPLRIRETLAERLRSEAGNC